MPPNVLEIHELNKRFHRPRPVQANDSVSISAKAGRIVGLLGHNGAGKTTLVNQIVGLTAPDSGSIRVMDNDAVAHPEKAREMTAVQAQMNVPITGLTPRQAIRLIGRMRGIPRARINDQTDELLAALKLEAWADVPSQKVSGGVSRLTSFCMTAIAPVPLVILDEPTNDVDPERRRLLWAQIRLLAECGASVLLVTHNVNEAENVVDDLVILDTGRVIASGTVAELRASYQHQEAQSLEDIYLDLVGRQEAERNA